MKRVFLVSCGRRKQDFRTRAGEMYTSPRFLRARELVEATRCPWFILSAKHGLLAPDEMITPYDMNLNAMPLKKRKLWAERVKHQMKSQLPNADKAVVLAEKSYCEDLLPYLKRRFATVETPLKDIKQEDHYQWLCNVSEI